MSIIKTHDVYLQGKVKGCRVRLVPLEDKHLPLLYKWNEDPEVAYWCDFDSDGSEGMDGELVNAIYGHISKNAHCFLVEADGEPIGDCWLQDMNIQEISDRYPGLNVKRIDMMIGEKDWWGKGVGSSIVGMLTDFAFEKCGVDVIYIASIFDFNIGSQRAFLKNGYKFAGAVDVESEKMKQEHQYVLAEADWTPCYNLTYERT
jgi:RimJ/RimL family protein N-acetyltransferase